MRLRGRQRNRWQNELNEDEDGRLVGIQGWKERVYNREEWKKLLRMARNHFILHMPMEWMNGLTIGFWCQVSLTHVDVDYFNIVYTVHHISHQFYLSTVNARNLWANHFVTITPTHRGICLCHLQGVLDMLKWHSHLLILRSQFFLYIFHLVVKYTQIHIRDSNMYNITTINFNCYCKMLSLFKKKLWS